MQGFNKKRQKETPYKKAENGKCRGNSSVLLSIVVCPRGICRGPGCVAASAGNYSHAGPKHPLLWSCWDWRSVELRLTCDSPTLRWSQRELRGRTSSGCSGFLSAVDVRDMAITPCDFTWVLRDLNFFVLNFSLTVLIPKPIWSGCRYWTERLESCCLLEKCQKSCCFLASAILPFKCQMPLLSSGVGVADL